MFCYYLYVFKRITIKYRKLLFIKQNLEMAVKSFLGNNATWILTVSTWLKKPSWQDCPFKIKYNNNMTSQFILARLCTRIKKIKLVKIEMLCNFNWKTYTFRSRLQRWLLKISANIFFIETAYLTSLKLKAVINLETFTSKAVVNFINKKTHPRINKESLMLQSEERNLFNYIHWTSST